MKFVNGKLHTGGAVLDWRLGFGNGSSGSEVKYISPEDMSSFTPAPNGGVWKNDS